VQDLGEDAVAELMARVDAAAVDARRGRQAGGLAPGSEHLDPQSLQSF